MVVVVIVIQIYILLKVSQLRGCQIWTMLWNNNMFSTLVKILSHELSNKRLKQLVWECYIYSSYIDVAQHEQGESNRFGFCQFWKHPRFSKEECEFASKISGKMSPYFSSSLNVVSNFLRFDAKSWKLSPEKRKNI